MYYFLKLFADKIEAGTKITERSYGGRHTTNTAVIDIDYRELYSLGENKFIALNDVYSVGDKTQDDLYDISYEYLSLVNDYGLGDEVKAYFNEFFESDLLPYWENLDNPVVFLMQISLHNKFMHYGLDYHFSVKVIKNDDLKILNPAFVNQVVETMIQSGC